MRISFERSGGFANISSTVDIDTSTLPASKAKQVQKLLEKARFFDQPTKAQRSLQARDEHQYQIKVTDGAQTHTIETSDTALSSDLANLIEWLEKEAAAKRKR